MNANKLFGNQARCIFILSIRHCRTVCVYTSRRFISMDFFSLSLTKDMKSSGTHIHFVHALELLGVFFHSVLKNLFKRQTPWHQAHELEHLFENVEKSRVKHLHWGLFKFHFHFQCSCWLKIGHLSRTGYDIKNKKLDSLFFPFKKLLLYLRVSFCMIKIKRSIWMAFMNKKNYFSFPENKNGISLPCLSIQSSFSSELFFCCCCKE